MQVQTISNTNFKAKTTKTEFKPHQHFVTNDTKQGIQKLLWQMNHQTVYQENKAGTSFVSTILASINMGNKYKLADNRFLTAPTDSPAEFNCDCSLKMGSNHINVNSTTGEVISYDISFFKSWSSLLKEAENCIKTFIENFNNNEIVKKNSFSIGGFTQKGFEILRKYT